MISYKIKKGKTLPDSKFLKVDEIFFDGDFIIIKNDKLSIQEFRDLIIKYWETQPLHKNNMLIISMCKALDKFIKHSNTD
jgi:hypothetical protein